MQEFFTNLIFAQKAFPICSYFQGRSGIWTDSRSSNQQFLMLSLRSRRPCWRLVLYPLGKSILGCTRSFFSPGGLGWCDCARQCGADSPDPSCYGSRSTSFGIRCTTTIGMPTASLSKDSFGLCRFHITSDYVPCETFRISVTLISYSVGPLGCCKRNCRNGRRSSKCSYTTSFFSRKSVWYTWWQHPQPFLKAYIPIQWKSVRHHRLFRSFKKMSSNSQQ